jgi:nucleotide-binding universal stress UspA family protein
VTIKSVLLGLICEERLPPDGVFDYAVDLAAQRRAHLAVGICVPRIEVGSAIPIAKVRGLVTGANSERLERAEGLAQKYVTQAKLAGVTVSTRIFNASYTESRDALARYARVNDLSVMQRSDGALSLEKDLAEECLFNSGRPVLSVPPDWSRKFALKTILIGWDGSARAARAVADSMTLLAAAETVDIACVAGDPRPGKTIAGAEIAEHLARHCRKVSVSELAAKKGDVAKTLLDHAKAISADLLVMGGFGHARFKEMLLGGVTQSMLAGAPLPVFMSY